MKRICGWCQKNLDEQNSCDGQENQVSTGICNECRDFFSKNTKTRPMEDFLNSLSAPVIVVDGERRVQFANESACYMLDAKLEDFKGALAGDALQCSRARLPGGCGRTEHCAGCAVRIAVEQTSKTGQDQEHISASILRETSKGQEDVRFFISTKKKDGLVLLRVEEVLESEQCCCDQRVE